MDIECVDRCTEWLAHFHNFFEFQFRWAGWNALLPPVSTDKQDAEAAKSAEPAEAASGEAAESEAAEGTTPAFPAASAAEVLAEPTVAAMSDTPQHSFVREVLARCLRLSYHRRIVREVPGEFGALAPEEPKQISVFGQMTPSARAALSETVRYDELLEYAGRDGSSIEMLKGILERVALPDAVDAEDGEHVETGDFEVAGDTKEEKLGRLQAKLFTHCLLQVGSATFTHLMQVVEKHIAGFKEVNRTPETRVEIVRTVRLQCSRHVGV